LVRAGARLKQDNSRCTARHKVVQPAGKPRQDGGHQKRVRELVRTEEISINQFVTTALAEKMSALMTLDSLRERSGRGSQTKFAHVLVKTKDRKPAAGDEL